MKKALSVLCVVLLLCSAITLTVSAAAGTAKDPIICNSVDLNMVKIPAGRTYYVAYTDTTGAAKRQISINSATDIEAGYTVTYGDVVQDSDENGYCNIVAAPDEAYTYLLAIKNKATKQATFFINFYEIEPYIISETTLYDGENVVTTEDADTTLFVYETTETGVFEFTVDKPATLSHWNGTVFYVTGLAEETTEGKLQVTCDAAGQNVLIGLAGVDTANITVTKIDDYTPPVSVEYVDYVNILNPQAGTFKLPDGELTKVDITVPQTAVLGSDGIYRYGSANGPIMYVDMTGVTFADLYACYYPAVADGARMRGTYVDENGKTCGYEFLGAMRAYADALDDEGFYYLTVDLANYLNMFGKDQGWFEAEFSPFEEIKNGAFIAESAWLVSAYYDPNSAGEDPVIPDEPVNPNEPATPDEPAGDDDSTDSPATGDVSNLGAIAALLMSSVGAFTFRKKHR